jgi:CubicO group peptidase (beta-lactamase class C family)
MSKNEPTLLHTRPEDAGCSADRLAQIRPGLQKFIDQGKVPNLVTLVARQGKVVHCEAQGVMDMDSKRPAKIDSIFRLYSNTKPLSGVATMMLYEKGLLDLDDPVSKYIPSLKNPRVRVMESEREELGSFFWLPTIPAKREITIRDCLCNTTGLASERRMPMSMLNSYKAVLVALGWYPGSPPCKLSYRERVDLQARLPLSFQPGAEFEYHQGYPVLGVILEAITGRNLEDFFQENILKPLGMKDSSFYLPREKLDRFSSCYQPEFQNGQWRLAVTDKSETSEKVVGPPVFFAAGGDDGGLLSTVCDYFRFTQMLLNGGELEGTRIISRKSVELMTSSHTGNVFISMAGPGFGFGLGVAVYNGNNSVPILRSTGSYGWGGAAGTTFFNDPKEQLTAICFTQVLHHWTMPENDYEDAFERLVYQSLL